MKNLMFLLSFILLFSSCEMVVDLDIPEHEPVLVVNSVLSTDQPIQTSISHSIGAFDLNSISSVNNASIEVFEDGELLGLMDVTSVSYFNYMGVLDSTYEYHLNHNPIAGKTYTYEIAHDDYENVRAETFVPNAFDLNVQEISLLSSDDYESQYRIHFSFDDDALNKNYYRLRLKFISTNYQYNHDFETSDASIISSEGVENDGVAYWGYEALFDDDLFNGTQKEISIDFWDWKSFYVEEEGYEVNYLLELTSISKAYYTYTRSLRAHQDNQDQFLFAGEPVQVYTNIENGLGILGASNTKSVEFILPE